MKIHSLLDVNRRMFRRVGAAEAGMQPNLAKHKFDCISFVLAKFGTCAHVCTALRACQLRQWGELRAVIV